MSVKVPSKLATARAYWRISSKFRRAGEFRKADHYGDVADRFYRAYLRDQEALARLRNR